MTKVAVHKAASGRRSPQEVAARPYPRGYTLPDALRERVVAAHRSRLWLTVLAAVTDHGVIVGLVLASTWVVLTQPPVLGAVAALVALIGVGRELRALECLIHEGSHFNWSRRRRRFNDALVFVFCGLPTGILVNQYRASHRVHHGRFAAALDPDRRRYIELDIEAIRRDSAVAFWRAVVRRLPRYQLGWLRELRTRPVFLLMPLGWAAVVVGLPAQLLVGGAAGTMATATWAGAYLILLPVIRFLGESSEHCYTDSSTVFDATVSNLGLLQRLFVHPHNDGYHTVHHMWPAVPHHALRRLHKLLVAEDWEGYGQRVRFRARLLEEPRSAARRAAEARAGGYAK